MKRLSVVLLGVIFSLALLIGTAQAADKLGYIDLSRTFNEYSKTKIYDKGLNDKEKVYAEQTACRLLIELAKLLQSTGDISIRPYSIDADVHHHVHNLSEQDIIDIEKAATESIGIPDSLKKVLGDLRLEAKNLPKSEQKEVSNDTEEPK